MSRARSAALSAAGSAGLLLALAAACTQTDLLGSRWVKQVPVQAAAGATLSVSAAESRELAGASLAIGPGDLAADAVITLEPGATALADDPATAGPAVLWGPAGTGFLRPVALAIPYTLGAGQSEADLLVLVADGSGTAQHVEHHDLVVDPAAGVIRLQASVLGGFQAAAVRRCTVDADCGAGSLCRVGECHPDTDDLDGGHHGPGHP